MQWLVYSGIGGEGTITNALSGDDVKQAIYLHKLIVKAMICTKVKHFNYCSNFLTEEGRKLLEDFQKCGNFENLSNLLQQLKPIQFIPGDMSCWLELYLEMVKLPLNVMKFQRTGNWNGFLQAIQFFLGFCFAMNRHNYARRLSYFISMLNLQDSHPNNYQYLKNGGFTASTSGLLFSKIPSDLIIETTINRSSKSTSRLSGKTENVGASEKWMWINHIMAALRQRLDSVI